MDLKKIYILVTDNDYSLPGRINDGGINSEIINNVRNKREAIKEAKKITRAKYINTNKEHRCILRENGRVIAKIISPDCSDPNNFPICYFCFKNGKITRACFEEELVGVIMYSCRKDKIKSKLIKDLISRIPIRILDLKEGKEIFSSK